MRLRALGSIGLGMVTAVLLVTGAACSSDDDGKEGSPATGGSPAGGGAAGGGGTTGAGGVAGNGGATGSEFQADAEAICQTILTLSCPNDQASTCVNSWTAPAEVQRTAGCGTQQKALYDCLAALPAGDFMCNESGFATYKPGVCSTELASLGDCTG